ncbi:MAG: hypothetical protein JRH20_32830, partial [Deltaproteobacteria bacterium]|nr:hypothetical protein [Deltaproteobacteria bacterium]
DVLVQVEQPAPDTTAPQVQILSPTANATVNGLLVLSAQVVDDGEVVAVVLRVDAADVSSLQQGPYDFQVPLSPGTHMIQVVARDAASNEGQASVSVFSSSTTLTGPGGTPDPVTVNGSCSVGGPAGGFGLPLLLLALGLFRRRSSLG